MADEEKPPQQWTIEHAESPHFRTVFASGAVFSGPIDGAKHWALTFYSDGARVVSETLVSTTDMEGAFTNATPPIIETQRVRRDEVAVIMTEAHLASLLAAIGRRLAENEK